MNELKEVAKQEGLTHFLTYADNFAIGYFKKQGFTKEVTMGPPSLGSVTSRIMMAGL